MRVTVDVAGGDSHEVTVEEGATYADLLAPLAFGVHEVSFVVDGRPIPEDQPVETDRVRVLRLIRGG